jgi:regulator of replication initiation timing
MNTKTAVSEQTKDHLLWANNMLEVQNEVLTNTIRDLRAKVEALLKENEILKTNNAVLKCTVQRIAGI